MKKSLCFFIIARQVLMYSDVKGFRPYLFMLWKFDFTSAILYMFCLVIFLCMFTNNAPPNQVHSFVSDPGGGGVLHLVSEQKVTRLGKKI